MRQRVVNSFWERVGKTSDCWWWLGAKDGYDYGRVPIENGNTLKAHRVSYEIHRHPIPKDMVIDHLCRNRACVNPEHLEVVTNRVNVLRGEGYTAKKAAQTHCKRGHELTEDNVYRSPSRPNQRFCRECLRGRWKRKNINRKLKGVSNE